jgi:hypothetical protein
MLVHSFSQSDTWFDDYQRFSTVLGVADAGAWRILP